MLLNITTTYQPASELSYLLHKHPDKFQTFELSIGKAHVFYPEISEQKTTASLLLDIDPIDMVRGSGNREGDTFALGHYVNDRPYVASSFMSVAIAKAFSSALNGKCKEKPELIETPMPFEVTLSVLPAPKGGEKLIRALFEPLGYEVQLMGYMLDSKFPEWGMSKYFTLHLTKTTTLKELLSHLYVLIPTLDHDKHYFVNHHEIEKLLQKGEGWLKQHPERKQIIKRYLLDVASLSRLALERISEGEIEELQEENLPSDTEIHLKKETLHQKRIKLVAEKLAETGASKVLDLGCGEGKLLRELLKNKQFTHILGVDVSYLDLLKAKERLQYDQMPPPKKPALACCKAHLPIVTEGWKDMRLLR